MSTQKPLSPATQRHIDCARAAAREIKTWPKWMLAGLELTPADDLELDLELRVIEHQDQGAPLTLPTHAELLRRNQEWERDHAVKGFGDWFIDGLRYSVALIARQAIKVSQTSVEARVLEQQEGFECSTER